MKFKTGSCGHTSLRLYRALTYTEILRIRSCFMRSGRERKNSRDYKYPTDTSHSIPCAHLALFTFGALETLLLKARELEKNGLECICYS